MNRELINAVLDGKTVQWQYKTGGNWRDFGGMMEAIKCLIQHSVDSNYNARIKPEPIPDKVYFDVVRKNDHLNLSDLKATYSNAAAYIKLTIKTDENGEQTKYVEIVK